jgi:hypothetical protein
VLRLVLLAALVAALSRARAGADEPCGPLFVIERSENANVVLYEAGIRPDGRLDPERPVRVSWRLDADGGRREGLNLIERMRAYGVDVSALGEGDAWRIRVRALPTRPLVLRAGAGCPLVIAEVGGREAILRRVFVASTGGLIPRVSSVELSGFDLETSLPVTERFVPSR